MECPLRFIDTPHADRGSDLIDVNTANAFTTMIEIKLLAEARKERGLSSIMSVILVGAHRRMEASYHDIDILLVVDGSLDLSIVEKILSSSRRYVERIKCGESRYSFKWSIDPRKPRSFDGSSGEEIVTSIDIATCPVSEIGSSLLHFTGPANFNILMRKRAIRFGAKLSEHGLFGKGWKVSDSEKEIFDRLHLPYISPENRGSDDTLKLIASQ